MNTAVIVTTKDRPDCLRRSLPEIVFAALRVDAPVLVVDDSENAGNASTCEGICLDFKADRIELPKNRGLAGALNIGLSYWLADPSIEAISYFQDDVEVDPDCIAACAEVLGYEEGGVVTGHDAKEHRERGDESKGSVNEIRYRKRVSCRATHMMATRESWQRVMPIPSRALGLPSRKIRDVTFPEKRGTGSGVDWWIVRDSPNRLPVLCIPGLVRTFAWKKADSTWDNEQIAGEDPPLSRAAIEQWLAGRA